MDNNINHAHFPWEQGIEPYHSDDRGDWYIDDFITEYCEQKGLSEYILCVFIKNNEQITRNLVDKNTNTVFYTTHQMESIAARLDIIAFTKPE